MKWLYYFFSISVLMLSACEAKNAVSEKLVRFEAHSNTLNQEDSLFFEISDLSAELIGIEANKVPVIHRNQRIALSQLALGKHELILRLNTANGPKTEKKTVAIYAPSPPKKWKAELVGTYNHDTNYYTQGLEFVGDTLYESTGQKGRSIISAYNPFTNEQYKSVKLDSSFFGEGITIIGNRLIQLTWQAKKGFIYDLGTLEKIEEFTYGASLEGWGLTHDDEHIYKSDGSEYIYTLNPISLEETGYLTVSSNSAYYKNANELERAGEYLYANVYQKNSIMVIHKQSGALEGVIDLGFLAEKLDKDTNFDPLNSVLNGIAYHPSRKTFFVTGKNWNLLFEMRFSPEVP
jgi:glutamine cyclotransferase